MPTEKRARQKAARRRKQAARARKDRLRRRLRSGSLALGGVALVILVVLATTTHVFGGGTSTPSKTAASTSSTTTTSSPATADAKLQAHVNSVAKSAGCPANPHTRVNKLHWSSPPSMTIDTSKTYSATVKTTAGTFTIDLLAKTAPHTVNNFVFLANQGFYHCVIFQRVIPGFMDQTGDPTGTGAGGPGYSFPNENLPSKYTTGDVAMANAGPNTNGSQFFIVVPGGGPQLHPTYSLFGKVTTGMPVVEKINKEGNSTSTGVPPAVIQRILSITIHTS